MTTEEEINAEFVEHVEQNINSKPVFMFVNDGVSVWQMAELGAAILLDKRIVVVARPGSYVPGRLLDLAHEVVRADFSTDAGAKDAFAAAARAAEDA